MKDLLRAESIAPLVESEDSIGLFIDINAHNLTVEGKASFLGELTSMSRLNLRIAIPVGLSFMAIAKCLSHSVKLICGAERLYCLTYH